MDPIITYLLLYIHYLHSQISELLFFLAKHAPLRQWVFDDSNSPKYQKFKIDRFPKIVYFEKQDYLFLIEYFAYKYGKRLKPVQRRNGNSIPENIICPRCGATHEYLYDNNGGNGQYQCKVCALTFNENHHADSPMTFKCPYCNHTLECIKSKNDYFIHKCRNLKCSYYLRNRKKLPADSSHEDLYKYKLHYIFRQPKKDLFKMDRSLFPRWFTGFKYRKNNAYIMGLCLTYHVNLGLSLRKTSQALLDIHNIRVSHTMVANYAKTAAVVIKPFVDAFDFSPSKAFAADETYIKIRGVKAYVWLIMDAVSRSILGYQVSSRRSLKPCIDTMLMAFSKFKEFPKDLLFVADGYPVYPLASSLFKQYTDYDFDVTQVIGLTNDDAVSEKFRPLKQIVERANRTFKASYRVKCGFDNPEGATYGVALWVAYYNFLRPHKLHKWKRPLNIVDELSNTKNMPEKWQLLLFLGQKTIAEMQLSKVS